MTSPTTQTAPVRFDAFQKVESYLYGLESKSLNWVRPVEVIDALRILQGSQPASGDVEAVARARQITLDVVLRRRRAQPETNFVRSSDQVREDYLSGKFDSDIGVQSALAALSTMARRDDVLEEAAREVEAVKADRDAFERRCGGWDDPTIPEHKRRSWHNPAAIELNNAAQRIRALKVQP